LYIRATATRQSEVDIGDYPTAALNMELAKRGGKNAKKRAKVAVARNWRF
jgi:hypothetical protein